MCIRDRGALGGGDGGKNTVTVRRGGESYTPEHLSKDQDIPIQPGDIVAVGTPGGGGFGNPFERDPDAVLQDVRRGYYTVDQAQALFGVVLAGDLSDIDSDATASIRSR